jgi:hypothetical protein
MTPRRIQALAVTLLITAVASTVAPTHPVYNAPGSSSAATSRLPSS